MSKTTLSLKQEAVMSRPLNAQAAGQGTDNGASVDMESFEGVMFIVPIGTITGAGDVELKAQQSSDDGSGDAFADLIGTSVKVIGSANSNKLAILDVYRPREQFVRPVVVRSVANAVLDGVIAIRYGARKSPTTQSADVGSAENHVSPVEGTA